MGDAEIFGGGVFISLWLISFFGYSAYQLRRAYEVTAPSTKLMVERELTTNP